MPSNELIPYHIKLSRNSTQFPCPHCGIELVSKLYEKHCSNHHNLNAKLVCVWCMGKYFWQSGKKKENVVHLIDCWQDFLYNFTKPPVIEAKHVATFTEFDNKPMCKPKQFSSHYEITNLPNRAREILWPMPIDPMLLFFQNDNLNLAAACVRKYIELKDETDWFHVMVRAITFSSFIDALDSDNGKTRTLPFSCWCNGGKYEDPIHRQHRHLIIVSTPKGHFIENVWIKVQIENAPLNNFQCKRLKPIASTLHLVNTLGYLSQRESRCNFSFKDKPKIESLNHFYIFTALPKNYKIVTAVQWDGGLLELVNQIYRRMKAEKLAQAKIFNDCGRWQIKIKDLPDLTLDLVLPVSDLFEPCIEETNYYFHLINGQKLYFYMKLEPEWNPMKQAKMGNRFYDIVGENIWYPVAYQQKCLNTAKVLMKQQERDEILRLEDENKLQKDTISMLETKNSSLENEIKLKDDKIFMLENENKLKDDKNSSLENENKLQKDTISSLENENKLKDDEILRLKNENKLKDDKFFEMERQFKKAKLCKQCQI